MRPVLRERTSSKCASLFDAGLELPGLEPRDAAVLWRSCQEAGAGASNQHPEGAMQPAMERAFLGIARSRDEDLLDSNE